MKTKTKTIEPTKTVGRSYLMWVGTEHYSGIDAYSDEAVTLGVSKRLPSIGSAKALMEPGSVVFVAHDEGESDDCPKCLGTLECPICRKRKGELKALDIAIEKIKAHFGDFEAEAPAGKKRSVKVRQAKITKLVDAVNNCELCDANCEVHAGTGGQVLLKDGTVMDYRQFNYWLHQPTKWDASQVERKSQCTNCGGTGQLPNAKVFGMFVPDRVEYIVTGEETKEQLDEMKKSKVELLPASVIKTEPKRGCGYRKAGGYYAVTVPGAGSDDAKRAVDELIESGAIKPEGIELHGSFIRFLSPIEVDIKRFRGIKTWALDARVEEEAEMVKEALEA
jgi:hypothetical protein